MQLPNSLQGHKNDFYEFESSSLAIHVVEIFEIFSTCFEVSILQDPTVTCVQNIFFAKFVTCIRNGIFGAFGEYKVIIF